HRPAVRAQGFLLDGRHPAGVRPPRAVLRQQRLPHEEGRRPRGRHRAERALAVADALLPGRELAPEPPRPPRLGAPRLDAGAARHRLVHDPAARKGGPGDRRPPAQLRPVARRGCLAPAPLPAGLVDGERHRRRQVQRAELRVSHRDGDGLRAVARQQVLWQADALAPEDQDRGPRVGHLLKRPHAAGGEEERRPQRRQRALEVVPARPDLGADARPVVEPGAPDLFVLEREAERTNEVQPRAGGQAGPPGVARVPVDLRLDEDDVQIAHFRASFGSSRNAPGARSPGSSRSPKRTRQSPSTWLPRAAKIRRTSWYAPPTMVIAASTTVSGGTCRLGCAAPRGSASSAVTCGSWPSSSTSFAGGGANARASAAW